MARTIQDIQRNMITALQTTHPNLSTSKVSEWRLWTYVVAVAIHTFELILDLFRREVDELTNKITPGTSRWYAEMCYRFQNGHELLFDSTTAMLYYANNDPSARIIEVVAIAEGVDSLSVKVAKFDSQGKIVPLAIDELYNFTGYVDSFKFAGVQTDVISTTADRIRYDLEVFYNPAMPVTTVQAKVQDALSAFRTKLSFDAMFYPQRMLDAVMAVNGVVTTSLAAIARQGVTDPDFVAVEVMTELQSGYFEYDDNCTLTLTSIKAKT